MKEQAYQEEYNKTFRNFLKKEYGVGLNVQISMLDPNAVTKATKTDQEIVMAKFYTQYPTYRPFGYMTNIQFDKKGQAIINGKVIPKTNTTTNTKKNEVSSNRATTTKAWNNFSTIGLINGYGGANKFGGGSYGGAGAVGRY